MTTDRREKVQVAMGVAVAFEAVLTWGSNDLARMLDNLPYLRVAFPQLLGIRDFQHYLSRIVNRAVVERSRASRAEAMDLASVFVPTRPYYRALSVIAKHNFVVLTGPPEMGKTTIARMIGLAKHSEGWQFIDCTSPEDFFQNMDDSINQVFLADDAFGTTEYVPELATPWGQQLSKILRRLTRTRWLIWTSRPTPLALALQHIHDEGMAAEFPMIAEVQVDAAVLTDQEKGMMLYRHAKSLQLTNSTKEVLKSCAEEIVSHRYLTPERIRRFLRERLQELCGLLATKVLDLQKLKEIVVTEITEPTRRMRLSFEHIGQERQQLLISMLDAGSRTVAETDVHASYRRLFGADNETSLRQLASDLDGHFLRVHRYSGSNTYEWIHPSWRDLVIEYLRDRPPKRLRFLSCASLHGLRLALSRGGGATGKRRSPLISSALDWNALTERIKALAADANYSTLHDAMRLVRETINNHYSDDSANVPPQLNLIGQSLLTSILTRWNRDQIAIPTECLAQYCALSTSVEPIVPLPELEITWKSRWEGFSHDAEIDYGRLFEIGKELIDFLQIVSVNEPRLLRRHRFPDEHVDRLESWITSIADYDAADCWPCNSDEVDQEMDFGSALCKLVECIAQLCPQLMEAAQRVIINIRGSVAGLAQCMKDARDQERAEQLAGTELDQRAWESEMERIYWKSMGSSPPHEFSHHFREPRNNSFVTSAEDMPTTLSELLQDL